MYSCVQTMLKLGKSLICRTPQPLMFSLNCGGVNTCLDSKGFIFNIDNNSRSSLVSQSLCTHSGKRMFNPRTASSTNQFKISKFDILLMSFHVIFVLVFLRSPPLYERCPIRAKVIQMNSAQETVIIWVGK